LKGCVKVGKHWRCRVASPSKFAKGSLRTITTKGGTKLIIGCPVGKYRKGRCTVGTRLQSKLIPVK